MEFGQMLDVELRRHQFACQRVKQLGMRRHVFGIERIDRLDQPAPKDLVPQPIHRRSCEQSILAT